MSTFWISLISAACSASLGGFCMYHGVTAIGAYLIITGLSEAHDAFTIRRLKRLNSQLEALLRWEKARA